MGSHLAGLDACEARLAGPCSASWCRNALASLQELRGEGEVDGVPHVLRVLCNALALADEEGSIDEEALAASVLLEALLSSGVDPEEAYGRLLEWGMPEHLALKAISLVAAKARGSPKEACILHDALVLEDVGAIGFYRAAVHHPESIAAGLSEVLEAARRASSLCSSAGRRIAARRLASLLYMYEALRLEYAGYMGLTGYTGSRTFTAEKRKLGSG